MLGTSGCQGQCEHQGHQDIGDSGDRGAHLEAAQGPGQCLAPCPCHCHPLSATTGDTGDIEDTVGTLGTSGTARTLGTQQGPEQWCPCHLLSATIGHIGDQWDLSGSQRVPWPQSVPRTPKCSAEPLLPLTPKHPTDPKTSHRPQKDFRAPQRILWTPKSFIDPKRILWTPEGSGDPRRILWAPEGSGDPKDLHGPGGWILQPWRFLQPHSSKVSGVFMAPGILWPCLLWPRGFPGPVFTARCVKVPPAIKIWELPWVQRLPGAAGARRGGEGGTGAVLGCPDPIGHRDPK